MVSIIFVAGALVLGALMALWAINPQPAKNAAAKAFNFFNLASFIVGVKAVNTINVAVQLKDARGNNVSGVGVAKFYLSDSVDGHTLTATATTSALAIGTNGVLELITITGKAGRVITDATGRFDLNLIQSASPVTEYLVVEMPDGSISVSPAVTW